jgi:hypothetical protein
MGCYDYTWKIGMEPTSNRSLKTNKPLRENTMFADLFTGARYVVQTIYDASATDRAWFEMPRAVIQTWPLEFLTDEKLNRLRDEAKYTPDEPSGRYYDIVFQWKG